MANPAVILKAEILGNAAGLIGAIDGANKAVDGFTRDTVEKFAGMSAQIGLAFAGFGAAITGSLGLAAKSSQEITNALGDMSSVGFKDLEGMRKAALDFSSAWSGTTAPDFVKSAYDIKSAIATLSDEGVIAVTRFSAITAKATKASADEMSRAFTTAYGIFKPMTKDMADAEWADRFSGIMAATAEKFRTTGSQMSDALKNLGATGAAAGISMQEQFAVLGQLQDVMPGAEAGTQYKAFLLNIGKGAEELGINVTDASGRLKSLPDILTAIQKKFPDLTNAAAQMKLKEAMGSEEAYRFILQMATGAERLSGNIKGLSGAWTEGSAGAVRMAEAMNVDPYVLFQQKFSGLMAEIGFFASTIFNPFVTALGKLVTKTREWITANPELTQTIVAITAAIGAGSLALGFLAGGASAAAFAFLFLQGAMGVFVLPVLLAIGSAILAIVVTAGGLISRFGELKAAVASRWTEIQGILSSASQRIQGAMIAVGQSIAKAFGGDTIKMTATQLVDFLILKFQGMVDWLVNVGIPGAGRFFLALIAWGKMAIPIFWGIVNAVTSFLANWGPLILQVLGFVVAGKAATSIVSAAVALFSRFSAAAKVLWGAIKFVVGIVVRLIAVIGAPWAAAILAIGAVIFFVYKFRDEIWGVVKAVGRFFRDLWLGAKQAAKDSLEFMIDLMGKVGKKISEIWGKIKNLARDTASTLTFGLVQASGPAPANIPQAANGGLLTGPKSGYLAMLHGTELVVPERMIPAISNSTMNQSSMVFNITQSDGESTEALANRIAEIWNRRRR